MQIPKENRNDAVAQIWLGLGGTHQFAAFMSYFESVASNLFPRLPSEAITAAMDFVTEEERTLGKSEKSSNWNELANVRNGFFTDIPGQLGELICAANIFTKYKTVSLPQDKYTQYTQKIDLITEDISVQVKVVRLEGNKLWIDPNWAKGEATHISLVDITDQEHWCIDRIILQAHGESTLTENELESISTHYWYNFGLYPRG